MNPRDAAVLADLAMYYANLGEAKLAAENLGRALKLAPNDPGVLFDAVLVNETSGQIDLAFDFLKKALKQGYSVDTARNAPAFDSLRGDPRFTSIFAEYAPRVQKSTSKTP